MNRRELITRATPFEGFAAYVQVMYLDTPKLDAFLAEKQSPFTKQDFLSFFNERIVQQTLARYWEYERGEKWNNRTATTAIWETVAHTFSLLHVMTENEEFQTMTPKQKTEFRQKTVLIAKFLETVVPQGDTS